MLSSVPRVHRLRALAGGDNLLGRIGGLLQGPLARQHTLLAVSPNSPSVVRAALQAAQEADAPLLFTATLNQIDVDGGYTGWTYDTFVAFVRRSVVEAGMEGPVFLGLDHAGPDKKDLGPPNAYDGIAVAGDALALVQRSVTAALGAGFTALHLDGTTSQASAAAMLPPVEVLVEHTIALMAHAEQVRAERGLAPLVYEVGLEEVGGTWRESRFEGFLSGLLTALDARGYPRPLFAVGDVGTALDTDRFDADRARRLADVAERHGVLVKAHFSDGVTNPEMYPLCGVGGANVGPGFAAVEHRALLELRALERQLGRDSDFERVLREALRASGRWKKWRRPDEGDAAFDDLEPHRQQWLVETGSRYVWAQPQVQAAREELYANVGKHLDADAFVLGRLRQAVLRYLFAFNLGGFNARLESLLG